ncbi:unnamed protein product [Clonostachys solani]|uniref:Uncharacterized protein n=1 Tax=Clonostachys solani TaxID=160281 RepID=A0A9N9YXT3_9HYPO|nr:unnamed protein product [Clonostachys solani]
MLTLSESRFIMVMRRDANRSEGVIEGVELTRRNERATEPFWPGHHRPSIAIATTSRDGGG